MSLISLLRLSQAPIAGFAAIGTGWGTFAAAIPDLKASLAISESELGLALFFGALGAVISMAASAKIMEWLGTGRKLIAVICLLLGAAFVGPSYATSLAAISVAMACVGLMTGLLDVVINARVSQLEARTGKHLMSLGHGMFSLAYAIAAICTGFAREAGFAPSEIYPVAAAVITLYAILAITAPEVVFARETPSDTAMPKPPLPFAVYILGALILIAFFAENATEIWSALHVERTLGGGAAQGSFGPALLGLTMAIGRFSGQALASRFGLVPLMTWTASLAAIGGVIAAAAPTPAVAYIGFACLGLGVSTLAPLGFALGGQYLTEAQRPLGIARMTLIGYMGFFFGPPVLGVLAEAFGLRAAFAVIGGMLVMFPILLRALSAPPVSPDSPAPQPDHIT